MRKYVLIFGLLSVFTGLFLTGCELLNKEVLLDDIEKTIINDSTTIRVMSCVPDSTQLIIETDTDWEADVNNEGSWCTVSKNKGRKGRDTIYVRVSENTTTDMRRTTLSISSGTMIKIFRVTQRGGESWIDTPYWYRTAAQRMGLHDKVERMTISDNWHPNESSIYSFDSKGNLLSQKSMDSVASRYDMTRQYTYDEDNHRLTCTVRDWKDNVIRKWKYEYENKGKLVAFSALVWDDADPLSEDMESVIVPDLSAVSKSWIEDDVEYHEDRTYKFEGEDERRLKITVEKWRDSMGVKVPMEIDSMRVSYQLYNGCNLTLPRASYIYSAQNNYVTLATYNTNGMVSTIETVDETYVFLNNVQRMALMSYMFKGSQQTDHEIDWMECEYNTNRDLLERRIYYHDMNGVTVETYPQYQYDDHHNWSIRYEELKRPDTNDIRQNYTKRDFVYYR